MNKDIIIILLAIYAIISTFAVYRMWILYGPQSTIVLHDYGQIFENENDWKIWRIEHEGR